MAYAKLIAFDRRLTGVSVAGRDGRFFTEAELAQREEAAYRRGVDATRLLADQQMVELRAEIAHLAEGVFKKLGGLEPMLVSQLRDALPALALDLSRRLLAGFEPSAEMVSRICEEALAEIFPERENLELSICPRDAALLEEAKPGWLTRFPGLRIRTDAALSPGDCQVRSRFGLTDARIQAKLTALEHSMNPR